MNDEYDLIVGIHSIVAALKNSERKIIKLILTDEARGSLIQELGKDVNLKELESQKKLQLVSGHKLQELAKDLYKNAGVEYQRVPNGALLKISSLDDCAEEELLSELSTQKGLKVLCLDQVSDVHNAAAILRTASFYGVDYVIVPEKSSFGRSPSFFRIASGATEYLKVVRSAKILKIINKMQKQNVKLVALTEHAQGDFQEFIKDRLEGNVCLVLGKEDTGISHAILRVIDLHLALKSQGDIKSLNVSIAAAIAMEKCFEN